MRHRTIEIAAVLRGHAFALLAAIIVLGTAALGQVSTGTLVGTVSDPKGALVSGSQVQATSVDTGEVHGIVTDSQGLYSIPSLPPGLYRVSVTNPGFGSQVATVTVLTDRTVRQDFALKVSSVNQVMEVVANSSILLETESHEVASSIEGVTIQNLPQTGRDVFSKLEAAPNVQNNWVTNGSSDIDFFGTGGNSLTIGGTAAGNTSYLQDGVLNYNLLTKTANMQPTPEDVNEVNVQANGASARYDGPAVVNVVTKGGTNSFHGQVYDYVQNDFFDAKGYFDTTKSQQRYQQFGASLGGPILKNKLQFFFAYDAERQHSFATNLQLVPTQDMFAGNFGTTTIVDPTTGAPFPHNTIPSSRISSFAKEVIPYYPAPNGSFAFGDNYYSRQGTSYSFDSYLGRLDYNLGPKDAIYGAYVTTDPVATGTSPIAPSIFNSLNIYGATNAYVTETHTFTPTLVNVARFGYNHSKVYETIAGAGKGNYVAQFGVPLVTPSPAQQEPPSVSFSGYTGFGAPFSPDGATQRNLQYADELNQVIGKHSLFYGIEADQMNMNGSWVIWNNGEFDFNGQYTGDAVADFLLGYPQTAIGGIGNTYGNFNQWQVMPYVQDDWKVSRRLTLNLGLRYDYYQAPKDSYGHAGVFILPTNSVIQGPYKQSHDTIAPRVGVAYALDDKTVVRGGYGIYYSTFMYNELQFMLANYPNFSLEVNSFDVNQLVPVEKSLSPPVPGSSVLSQFTTGASMPTPRVQQWNVAVQRSLGTDWSASITYLGNKAKNLQQRFNPNQASLPPDPNNPTPIQTRRPYPNVGDVYEAGDVGWANYNGLQVELVRRFSHGLSLDANYVWSKALDVNSQDSQNPRDGRNLALDYGLADFDRRHVFKFSSVWELPIGPGKLIAKENNWFNRTVIGGWQTSELLAIRSSAPFTVYANNTADVGANFVTNADQVCSSPYAPNRKWDDWLNVSCFAQPTATLGNTSRNAFRGPSIFSLDASVSKYFPITEQVKVKFGADFLNALNHPMWQFNYGSQSVATPGSLGVANYLGSTRVIQLSLHAIF